MFSVHLSDVCSWHFGLVLFLAVFLFIRKDVQGGTLT
ncbi:DUF3976 domain-containing protein, partial [Bacillus sp. D-CC]